GASEIEIAMLDRGLTHFAEVCQDYFETDATNEPGAGAAGGLGFALRTFLGAEFQTGASLAFHLTHFSELLEGADLCITGEGQTDFQTAYGKLPAAVANACVEHGVPCVCLSGSLGKGWQCLYDQGFSAIFSLCQRPETLEQAMQATPKALADAAEAVCRLFTAHSNSITTGA
ncbi:MAG TPA: glycerate kinase, partial [Armatimonadota bacterium]|nr:glycerate kinase [Armatimonadota bacterium]